MKMSERVGHALAGLGQNLVYNFLTLFLLAYLYEALHLSSAGTALLTVVLTAVRIWDAVNDLAVGLIIDRTRTRWGTFRPYPLITALPIAILTTALFAIPSPADRADETRVIALVALAYLLWDVVYTASDVPYWSLTSVMTPDEDERTRVVAWARVASTVAIALMVLGGPLLAKSIGWTASAALVSFVGMALFTLAFFATKERVPHNDEPAPLKQSLRILAANRPLQWLLLSMVLGFGTTVFTVGGAVMAVAVFGDIAHFTLLGGAMIVGTAAGMLATPAILRRTTARPALTRIYLAAAAIYVVLWFVGFRSLLVVAVGLAVAGVTVGMIAVITTRMIADTADETEVRTGERTDGASFAGQTFTAKLNAALATLTFGMTVAASGYVFGDPATDGMRAMIWAGVTLVPAASMLCALLPLRRYDIDERTLAQRLQQARAARVSDAESAG